MPNNLISIDQSICEDSPNVTSSSAANSDTFGWLPYEFNDKNVSSSSPESVSVPDQNEKYKDFLVFGHHELENSSNAMDLDISHSSLSFERQSNVEEVGETASTNADCARLILNEMENALKKPSSTAKPQSQLSINDMLQTYYKNLEARSGSSVSFTSKEKTRSFFAPTHSHREMNDLEWPHLLSVNRLGVIYNTNDDCEKLEGLFKKYIDAFIETETSSSYTSNRIAVIKKVVEQLRVTGLRQKIFSAANLKSSSSTSYNNFRKIQPATTSGRLLLIDKTKLYSKTSHAGKRTSAKKRTPKSKSKSQQKRCPGSASSQTSSKRALFTSPVHHSTEPRKLPRRTLFSPVNDENKKRKLSPSPDRDRGKQRRTASPSKLQKSQSFSIASSSTSSCNSFRKKLFTKTQSEVFMPSSDSPAPKTLGWNKGVLDMQIKQKILWSVSTALNSKQISNHHEKFKEYASILAKLVKRIFLEFHDPVQKSISGELMTFATMMVTQVVVNRYHPDQVYSNAKETLLKKNASRVSGYIGLVSASQSCSSLNFSQQSENSGLSDSGSSRSLFALRENTQSANKSNKKFGSESNLTKVSSTVMKAKRQISF